MRTIKSQLRLLKETVKFYHDDVSRRSLSTDGDCVYLAEDGNSCAVGRCMKKESLKGHAKFEYENADDIKNIEKKLYKRYRGFHIDLWVVLQVLHDTNSYWDDKGLTDKGHEKVDELSNSISNGEFI